MNQKKETGIALYMPNIVNVCVDEDENGELSGRIYHCYDENPVPFANVIRMVESMEDLYDRIAFPQASTKTRVFSNTKKRTSGNKEKVKKAKDVAAQRGKLGTFLVSVRYRQNSSWQGEAEWVESGKIQQFVSVLELLKILSNALEHV